MLSSAPEGGLTGNAPVSHSSSAPHISVLLDEVVAHIGASGGGDFLDGTFGAGGYTRAILDANPKNRVLALDRDPTAIVNGQAMVGAYGGRLTLFETEFARMEEAAEETGFAGFDGVVLDIGVSSMQLDQALRGFSFRNDGPLDMRMAQGGKLEGESAAEIVNEASEERLADIIYHYGEERLARVIARAIVHDRKEKPFTTTRQLSDMIGRIVRSRPGDIHPATRTFQALRIAVNDELNELAKALHAAERLLRPGGKLVVVSFHSLEDRIVKVFLAARSGRGGGSRYAPVMASAKPTFKVEGKFPVTAGEAELSANPRSRSAKLRAAIRLDAPAQGEDESVFALAALPETAKRSRPRKSSSAKPASKARSKR